MEANIDGNVLGSINLDGSGSSGNTININDGAMVANPNTIRSFLTAVSMGGAGNILNNAGTITAFEDAVYVEGGSVTNSGDITGKVSTSSATIDNSGSIVGDV